MDDHGGNEMMMNIPWELRKYATDTFDEKKCITVHTVSLSKTPETILEEMRQINKSWRKVNDDDYFTFVD